MSLLPNSGQTVRQVPQRSHWETSFCAAVSFSADFIAMRLPPLPYLARVQDAFGVQRLFDGF